MTSSCTGIMTHLFPHNIFHIHIRCLTSKRSPYHWLLRWESISHWLILAQIPVMEIVDVFVVVSMKNCQVLADLTHYDVLKSKHFPCYWPFCAGNSPATGEFPLQRPVTRSFDVFFGLPLNKRLSEQSRRRWLGTPSCLLWRHSNDSTTSLDCTKTKNVLSLSN